MQITSLQKNHIQEIILLSNQVFGENFLTKSYLLQYINSTNHVGYVLVTNKNLIGYLLAETLNFKQFTDSILIEKEWFKEHFKDYNNINLIQQIAINKQYQKQGFANQLIKETTNHLSITCCLAWKKGKVVALKNTLLKNDFNYLRTIDNYWSKDSLVKKYNCVFCGQPPCNCSAEVYIKKNASI